jgi:hypothetical protein
MSAKAEIIQRKAGISPRLPDKTQIMSTHLLHNSARARGLHLRSLWLDGLRSARRVLQSHPTAPP